MTDTRDLLAEIAEKMHQILDQNIILVEKIEELSQVGSPLPPDWINIETAIKRWGLNDSTRRNYRRRNTRTDGSASWKEGLHHQRGGLYNWRLIDHWWNSRGNARAHDQFCQKWIQQVEKVA
ncbi:MAG: hypothetical protein AAF572_14785 [Cyanobacteria bacterium P01_B01_bin.77]